MTSRVVRTGAIISVGTFALLLCSALVTLNSVSSAATIRLATAAPRCGNSKVETGEECDLGRKNGKKNSACSDECEVRSVCGDGQVEEEEECDLASNNGKKGYACSRTCEDAPPSGNKCGNGRLDQYEECDIGQEFDPELQGVGCSMCMLTW